ncbi:hypothetical protein [Herbaspirillum frisingense]|nr:hypothetical protein [Herbaspirillum frisingense]
MNFPALFFLALIPVIQTAGLPRNATLALVMLCALAAAFSGVFA